MSQRGSKNSLVDVYMTGYDMGRKVRDLEHWMVSVTVASVLALVIACLALYQTL